jgi:hypothetical protein
LGRQWFRLALDLGVSRSWAALHVLGGFALFGTSAIGFRYYALSSTLPAYVAYLRLLRLMIEKTEKRDSLPWPILSGLLLVIATNHRQELAYALIAGGCVVAVRHVREWEPRRRSRALRVGIALLAAGYVGGYVARQLFPAVFYLPGVDYWTKAGYVRLWARGSPFSETIALPGLLSLFCAAWILKRAPLVAVLTIIGPFLLLFPPTAWLLSRFCADSHDLYRVLYLMTPSLALLIAIESASHSRQRAAWIGTALLLTLWGMWPDFPWRGRLLFHFTRSHPVRSLEAAAPLAGWIHRHLDIPSDCPILTDDALKFALASHLARPVQEKRHKPLLETRDIHGPEDLLRYLQASRPPCALIIRPLDRTPRQLPVRAN